MPPSRIVTRCPAVWRYTENSENNSAVQFRSFIKGRSTLRMQG